MILTAESTLLSESSSFIITSNNPLYMHPPDNPGASLVPVSFTRVGYRSWRRSVLRFLSVKNMLGFINKECMRLRADHPMYRQLEM